MIPSDPADAPVLDQVFEGELETLLILLPPEMYEAMIKFPDVGN